MSRKLELIGVKKGTLTVIANGPIIQSNTSVVCLCECGRQRIMKAGFFKDKSKKFDRCVCYFNRTAHYQSHPLYCVWKSMRTRCNWKNGPRYKDYGGRGIKVCRRWDNFLLFLEDILPIWRPGLQLDRIDNDGDYCPENVQAITPAENARKRPSTKIDAELAKYIRDSDIMGTKLSKLLGVSKDVIYAVKSGKTWKEI